jgi:hypothetical protein
MGLAQTINFNYSPTELEELLFSLRYVGYNQGYILKTANCSIEVQLVDGGIFIHKVGDYFYYFGLLIEKLGEISESLLISDQ